MESGVSLPAPWRAACVAVVVPTFNEADNLRPLVAQLLRLPLPGLRVLVADDNSPDGTGKIADELASAHPGRLSVLHRSTKAGLGRAYVAGFTEALAARPEFVVQLDADLSHPPSYIPQMLGTLLSTDADVVVGSRYVVGGRLAQEWPVHRKVLSWWANAYVDRVLRVGVRDVTAGYKMWRADSLRRIGLERVVSEGYAFQVEMQFLAHRLGMKTVEIPIEFDDRVHGASKMSATVQVESALMPWRLRWQHRARSDLRTTPGALSDAT